MPGPGTKDKPTRAPAPADANAEALAQAAEQAAAEALAHEAERAARDAAELAAAGADAPPETPKDRRARLAREQAKKAAKESRYTPSDGCEWVEVEGLGDISVCESQTGFFYVVFRGRGREHAIPLIAVEKLQEAGQV